MKRTFKVIGNKGFMFSLENVLGYCNCYDSFNVFVHECNYPNPGVSRYSISKETYDTLVSYFIRDYIHISVDYVDKRFNK